MGGESNGNRVTVTVNTEGVRCYKVHLLYLYNKCPLGRGGHSPISVTDTMLLLCSRIADVFEQQGDLALGEVVIVLVFEVTDILEGSLEIAVSVDPAVESASGRIGTHAWRVKLVNMRFGIRLYYHWIQGFFRFIGLSINRCFIVQI